MNADTIHPFDDPEQVAQWEDYLANLPSDFQFFDALPKTVREALAEAPTYHDHVKVYRHMRKHDLAAWEMVSVIRRADIKRIGTAEGPKPRKGWKRQK